LYNHLKHIKTKPPSYFVVVLILSMVSFLLIAAIVIIAPHLFRNMLSDSVVKDSGNVDLGEYYSTDSGITLCAKVLVSDTSRTVFQTVVMGKKSGNGIPDLKGITLKDDYGNSYDLTHWGSESSYNSSDVDTTTIEFKGGPTEETCANLSVAEIDGVKGSWNIKIPIKPVLAKKSMNCSAVYNFDNGISFKIDKVTFNTSQTIFHGTFNNYFEIDCMGPIHYVVLYDNGKQITDTEYNGNSTEFTVKTPPVGVDDEIRLEFDLGIDHTSKLIKNITFSNN
jgi:hypothetical protein